MIVKHNEHPTKTAERVVGKLRERGVAKTHAASEFGGAKPSDELADDIKFLVDGRAKSIDEAGPLPSEGALTGPPKAIRGQPGSSTFRGDMGENAAAKTLADNGYKVEQIPEAPSSLDYRINGREYDCYTPYFDPTDLSRTRETALKQSWDRVKSKLDEGKTRVVVNLGDFNAPTADVLQYFRDNPFASVDDLIFVKNNQVIPYWEFLR